MGYSLRLFFLLFCSLFSRRRKMLVDELTQIASPILTGAAFAFDDVLFDIAVHSSAAMSAEVFRLSIGQHEQAHYDSSKRKKDSYCESQVCLVMSFANYGCQVGEASLPYLKIDIRSPHRVCNGKRWVRRWRVHAAEWAASFPRMLDRGVFRPFEI
jgi:hypothetical protein